MTAKCRVLYVCTEDWYFRNHRLDHAKALIANGFEVHVATRPDEASRHIAAAGCVVHPLEVNRGVDLSLGLLRDSWNVVRIIRRTRPQVVHAVSMKAIALTLPSVPWFRRSSFILAVNGLGVSSVNPTKAIKVLGWSISLASRLRRVKPLFQNYEDPASLGVPVDRITLIPGVGVNLDLFPQAAMPAGPPWRVVYLGRAVRSKGLMDISSVATRPAVRKAGIEFHLYCAIDSTSPGALSEHELDVLRATPGVVLHPHTDQPFEALASCHLALLPSHGGEGVSKFLLEAMTVGRPVVLTQTAGASVVLGERHHGSEYAPGDIDALEAILLEWFETGESNLGHAGDRARKYAIAHFSLSLISGQIVALHMAACELVET